MMKKIYSILAILMLCMTATAQTWNFRALIAADESNLKADADWIYTADKARYSYNKAIDNAPLTANGAELEITKGLVFTIPAADKLRIDASKQIQLNGTNLAFSIKNLIAGQNVKITFASSSKSVQRTLYPTNLNQTSGFEKANSGTVQTATGIVEADGDVTFTSNDGGINLFSIEVTDAGSENPSTEKPHGTLSSDNSVAQSTTKNQAVITTTEGTTKFYNTEDISDIAIDKTAGTLTVNGKGYSDVYTNLVSELSFTKAAEQGEQGEVTENGITITESKGWLEAAYAKWNLVSGAKKYNVYVKGGQYADYTKMDDQLVRNYGTYGRADIVGLMAGTYSIKVVAVDADGKEMQANGEAKNLEVRNYSREGFAHKNMTSGVGAYNNDGTLKAGAIVLYVTKNTAKTVSASLANGTFTGMQTIIDAYQKKGVTQPPLDIRVIGTLTPSDLDAMSSSAEGIQIKGANADQVMNITIEGIGDDATIKGFGFLVRNSKSVEMRNFGVMRQMDDGISLDTDNSNIWIHNIDVFYGKSGSGDHAKGDGGIDVKSDSKFITIDNCHFWDTGKSTMCGMKSESGPNYITYHHNWFDHSDSRHARVRTMSVHMWNNYYDGVAKYGVGAATGSNVFMEGNYFRDTKFPMTIGSQGHDIKTDGTSVLSGEEGGMVKAFNNIITKEYQDVAFTPYTESATNFDAYVVNSRDEKVPSTVTALKGGHSYSNFDTDASLMYTYTADATSEVPSKVTGFFGAGRLNHGDCQFAFNNAADDNNAEVNNQLASLIDGYTTTLVGIFGDENAPSTEQGSQETLPGSQTGETGSQTGEMGGQTSGTTSGETETITSEIECYFNGSVSNNAFTFTGAYGDCAQTVNGQALAKGAKINSKGSITFSTDKEMQLTVVLGNSKANNISIDGTTISGDTNFTVTTTIPAGQHTIAKGKASEYLVMYIGLK